MKLWAILSLGGAAVFWTLSCTLPSEIEGEVVQSIDVALAEPVPPLETPASQHDEVIVIGEDTSAQTKEDEGGEVVFEQVEDYGMYPKVVSPEEFGSQADGLNVLPPDHPLMAESLRLRGTQWPMVANEGSSRVYPNEKGKASFYWQCKKVATGDKLDSDAMTAAHKTLPFGTIVRCTRTDTGQSVVVTINDRGPYVKGRIIDLSLAAAREIGLPGKGVVPCVVEVLAYPLVETMGPKGHG